MTRSGVLPGGRAHGRTRTKLTAREGEKSSRKELRSSTSSFLGTSVHLSAFFKTFSFVTVEMESLDDSHDDLHSQRAEDEAVRFRTEAALKVLAADLEEVRAVRVAEDLSEWRADAKSKLDALTAKLKDELERFVPDAECADAFGVAAAADSDMPADQARVQHESDASGDSRTRSQDVARSAADAPAAHDAQDKSRGGVMAELARREAARTELLASLMS